MGIQFCETKSQTTMKVLLCVALAVAAVVAEPEAEADAAVLYSGHYGHPGYYGYGGYGLGYRGYYGGLYGYGLGHYGYGYRHFGKRSADAEPEADADAAADAYYGYYGRGYGYGYGLGYGRYYGGYYGYPYAGYGYRHFGKRSADAEPEADAAADAYYGYYGPLPHRNIHPVSKKEKNTFGPRKFFSIFLLKKESYEISRLDCSVMISNNLFVILFEL